MAGSGEVYRQAFRQAGVIHVEDFDELAQTVELFAEAAGSAAALPGRDARHVRRRAGRDHRPGVAVGVELPALAPETLADLQKALLLPDERAAANPLDAGTGFAIPASYQERMGGAIRVTAADAGVDIVAILQGFSRDAEDLRFSLNHEIMLAATAAEHQAGKAGGGDLEPCRQCR